MDKENFLIVVCSLSFEKETHGPAKFIKIIYNHWRNPAVSKIFITPDSNTQSNIISIDSSLPRFFGIFWELIYSFRFYKKIKELSTNKKIDGIVFTDVKLSLFSSLLLRKVPILGMLNDYENINLFRALDSYRLKNLIVFIKSYLIEITSLSFCKNIIVNSKYLQQDLGKKILFKNKNVFLLYKSIVLADITQKKQDYSIDPKNVKILFAKNDFIRGGLLELILAINSLSQYNFTLTIIGPNPKKLNHYLSKIQIKNNVKVVFKENVNNAETICLMEKNDLFCVPARREALGLANIEAMAVGTPIVSTSIGGILETTNEGRYAWLAQVNDPKSLANKINEFLNDTNREIKTQNAMDFVEKNFSHYKMIENFDDIVFKTLLEKRMD